MQNKTTKKPEKTISLSNLPSIIVAVVLIVGIGAVYGLLGYLVSGIKENITPATQKPSMEITNNYFGNEFIQVKSPQKNATIKNPVSISGKANVFEANVRVRILDSNKNILADTFITAGGWMDKLYLFEKEISYKIPQTKNGLIEIFEESAKDGSDLYKVEVPVIFGEYEDAFSDWKVYRNEEFGFEVKYPGDWDNPLWQENEYRKGITFGCPVFDFEGNEYCPLSLSVSKAITKNEAIRNKRDVINIPTIKEFTVDTREAITYQDAGICLETCTKIFDSKMTISFMDRCSVYKGKIFDQILSTFKFIEKNETADENKPSIYPSKGEACCC